MGFRCVILATLFAACWASDVRARGGAADLGDVALRLQSGEADEVAGALEDATVSGDPAAVPLIVERVAAGLPPALLERAMDALTMLGDPAAGPLFARLSRHRRPAVRVKALQALVTLRAPGATRALRRALGDMDRRVRAAAAEGLGTLGAREALDALFLLYDRGEPAAAPAIGALADGRQLARVTGYLGRRPFGSVAPILGGMLANPRLRGSTKLRIVAALEELATPDARAYLEQLAASLPAGVLRDAARVSAERIAAQ